MVDAEVMAVNGREKKSGKSGGCARTPPRKHHFNRWDFVHMS